MDNLIDAFEKLANLVFVVLTILAIAGLLPFSWWWVLAGIVVAKVLVIALIELSFRRIYPFGG